jgi:1,4-dihydroxy-2-naphthoate octaprenyltransferase
MLSNFKGDKMRKSNSTSHQFKTPLIWWRLLRPHTLTASFVPVAIGSMLALKEGQFNPIIFLAMLIASILIQCATNMFNEYYDYKRGLDHAGSVGIGGTIVRDGVAPLFVRNLAFIFCFVAILIGIYICAESSWWLALIGTISIAMGYYYTGGPYPIAYSPFGELVAGFFMGTVIIAISYYIQTLSVSFEIIMISLPIAFLVAAILLANNIRDLEGDKRNGRKTIAILVGKQNAIRLLGLFFIAAYLQTIGLIISQLLTVWSVLTFLSIPLAVRAVIGFHNKRFPSEMMPAMVHTAKTNTLFGFLLILSLIIGLILN